MFGLKNKLLKSWLTTYKESNRFQLIWTTFEKVSLSARQFVHCKRYLDCSNKHLNAALKVGPWSIPWGQVRVVQVAAVRVLSGGFITWFYWWLFYHNVPELEKAGSKGSAEHSFCLLQMLCQISQFSRQILTSALRCPIIIENIMELSLIYHENIMKIISISSLYYVKLVKRKKAHG